MQYTVLVRTSAQYLWTKNTAESVTWTKIKKLKFNLNRVATSQAQKENSSHLRVVLLNCKEALI